jgi:hypothetical protein
VHDDVSGLWRGSIGGRPPAAADDQPLPKDLDVDQACLVEPRRAGFRPPAAGRAPARALVWAAQDRHAISPGFGFEWKRLRYTRLDNASG